MPRQEHETLGAIADVTAEYVTTPAALEELCRDLDCRAWFALDTEFIREETYQARLCLIQVATDERIACIDPLALTDLEPLLAVLANPAVTKVLHSASQDLEIFYQRNGRIPAPIFDTQVAAPLLGYGDQPGFARLVEHLLGVTVDKSQTRTDWQERPLPAAALDYAANDVRYLVPLYRRIHAELERRGRLDWLAAEMAALTRPERYAFDPSRAWRRLKGVDRLPAAGRAAARDIAAWREERAREQDIPRGWVLRDDAVVDLARTRPKNRRQLDRIRGLKPQTLTRYGDDLLRLIAAARADSAPATVNGDRPEALDESGEALVDALTAVVRLRAAVEDLNPQTIAGRKELARIARGEPSEAVLAGWRHALVGPDLAAFLAGDHVLQADPAGHSLQIAERRAPSSDEEV